MLPIKKIAEQLPMAITLVGFAAFGAASRSTGITLALSKTPAKTGVVVDDKSLTIVQATPEGIISLGDERKEVFIVFSHPMVPLATLDDETKGVFTVSPATKGAYRWYGSRIAAFVPQEDWQQGKEYTVTLKSEVASLKGLRLKEAKTFKFRFAVPDLTASDSTRGGDTLKYDATLGVEFNFAVSRDALKEHARLTENGKAINFTLRESEELDWRGRTKPKTGKEWQLIPAQKLGKASQINLKIKSGLKAKGVLTDLPSEYEKSWQTYGDLNVEFETKEVTWPNRDEIQFRFSNPVNAKIAAKAIRFSPAVKISWLPGNETQTLGLSSFQVEPGKRYEISVDKFADVMGNILVKSKKFEVTLPDRDPYFHRVESGSVLEAQMKQNYPLLVSNLANLTARVEPFTIEDVLDYAVNPKAYSLREATSIKSAKPFEFKTGLAKNAIGRAPLNLTPYLKESRGWLLAEVTSGEKDSTITEAIQATDLAITARAALGGSHVWVHSLTNGTPVSGAKVSRYTGRDREGDCKTNDAGYCLIQKLDPRAEEDVHTFLAETTNDKAFVTSKSERLHFGPSNGYFAYRMTGNDLKGVIVFDRRLHSPGDTVYFKAALTQKIGDSLTALAKAKVNVDITAADGKSIYNKNLTTSDQGGVGGEIAVARDAALGHYTVSISADEDKFGKQSVQETFQVEEFRPVSFAVAISGLKNAHAGDTLKAEIGAHYLFGAPLASARYQVDASRTKRQPSFDNFPDYNFADLRYAYFGEQDEEDSGFFSNNAGRLAANGKTSLSMPLAPLVAREKIDLPEPQTLRLGSAYTFNIDATVRDVDDKSVSTRGQAVVSAGKFVYGIRARDRYTRAKAPIDFELVALSTDGRDAGAANATVRIVHTTWKSIHTLSSDESLQTKNNAVRTLVTTETVGLGAAPTTYTFIPEKSGEYYILVQGENGQAFARTSFYVSGDSDGFYMRDDDSVSLMADKTHYKPGETAKIVIQSPVKTGRVIISLERERIYWQKQIELTDYALTVPVEIKEEYLPNVYLTALIIKPRERIAKRTKYEDMGAPAFKVGSIGLTVDNSSRKAKFALEYDKPQYGPGDTVKMLISTESDAEIALSVADRAVLDLINYHFENPVQNFFSSWPLAVEILENRHAIIHQYDFAGKGSRPGGGPGEHVEGAGSGARGFSFDNDSGTRKNFRYTAFWKDNLRADKSGKAELTFKLPDNLSTFRIMALAAAGGKYTNYEKEFKVQKALVVQPLMPRFIRAGDELRLGAVVINQTGQAGDFEIGLQSNELNAGLKTTVTIAAGESREVSYPVKLKNGSSTAVTGFVSARALSAELIAKGFKAEDLTDRVKFEFPVAESPSIEAFAIAGFTDSRVEEAVVIPKNDDILPGLGSFDIKLSSTALVGLDRAFEFYRSNPYLCLEQRASAYLLAITSGELLKSFAIKAPNTEGYDFNTIEKLFIGELREFVNADGGLVRWKLDPRYPTASAPYLSAYVLSVLQQADLKKASTDGGLRRGIVNYIENFLKKNETRSESYGLETLAMINLALARENAYRKDLTKFLLQNEAKLSLRAKARIMLAIQAKEKLKSAESNSDTRRLMEAVRSRMEVTTTSIMLKEIANVEMTQAMYTANGTLATVLEAMTLLDRSNSLIPQMVTQLLKGKGGYDTHSIGLIATALDRYRSAFETDGGELKFSASVLLGKKSLISESLSSHKLDVISKTMALLELKDAGRGGETLPLIFDKGTGKGRLYYSARLKYATAKNSTVARDEGIEIQRKLFSVTSDGGKQIAKKISPSDMRRGEIYLQKLMVTIPKPAYNVVLVDPLAAQTEVMNPAFQTEKIGAANADTDSEKPKEESEEERYYWGSGPTRLEYRNDRVLFFFDYIPAGYHEYRYAVRPIVKGKASHPPAQASLMYEPEIFGRSGSHRVIVE